LQYLIGAFRYEEPAKSASVAHSMQMAFMLNDIGEVIRQINSLFSTIPYHIFESEKESYYHALTHLIFTYLGVYVQSEVATSRGRCDALVETETHIFILEFKLNQSAAIALNQIKEKKYAVAHQNKGIIIVAIGVNFDSKKKEVGEWLSEEI